MTPPPRAKVWWKDHRPATIVYLKSIHLPNTFTGGERVFWSYEDFDRNTVGPGRHTTREWAWEALRYWARQEEAGATPFSLPEDRDDRPELPAFWPNDDEGNPAEERAGL